jgi:UDP-3-O-[3-hydroxymyristoyl] glucosamine N-acyltransferase
MINLLSIKNFLINSSIEVLDCCDNIDYVNSSKPGTLTFAESQEYLKTALENSNINAILVHPDIGEIPKVSKEIIFCQEPNFAFHSLLNAYEEKNQEFISIISDKATIDASATISNIGVIIEQNVIIESYVTVFPFVTIKAGSIIRSGAKIGCEAIERRSTNSGDFLFLKHEGTVFIDECVKIGPNVIIERGLRANHQTYIGRYTTIGALSNVSHNVIIGQKVFVANGVLICGSSRIEDNVWLGPGSIVSNSVTVHESARVEIGSMALKNVSAENRVFGYRHFPKNFVNVTK